jgi:hypothetical protein
MTECNRHGIFDLGNCEYLCWRAPLARGGFDARGYNGCFAAQAERRPQTGAARCRGRRCADVAGATSREGASALVSLGAIPPAPGCACGRRVLVCDRRPAHVDGRCLCRSRQGRHRDGCLGDRRERRRHRERARHQLLYRLDRRRFQIALRSAEADLAETVLTSDARKQDYRRALRK